MKILQIGMPRSGNYWLWKIIQAARPDARSFLADHPIAPWLAELDLSHIDQSRIDMIEIGDQQLWWRVSSIVQVPIDDPASYLAQSDHVWTHSQLAGRSAEIYDRFDRLVYIVRDPRDRLLSAARFALTAYGRKYWPHGHETVADWLTARLDDECARWNRHVADHLDGPWCDHMLVLRYEDLLADFDAQVGRLLDFLGLDRARLQAIGQSTAFSAMRERSPQHLHRGQSGHGEKHLSEAQQRRIEALTGAAMERLGYQPGAARSLAR